MKKHLHFRTDDTGIEWHAWLLLIWLKDRMRLFSISCHLMNIFKQTYSTVHTRNFSQPPYVCTLVFITWLYKISWCIIIFGQLKVIFHPSVLQNTYINYGCLLPDNQLPPTHNHNISVWQPMTISNYFICIHIFFFSGGRFMPTANVLLANHNNALKLATMTS